MRGRGGRLKRIPEKELPIEKPKTRDDTAELMWMIEDLARDRGLRVVPESFKLHERIQRTVDHKLEMRDLQDLLTVSRITGTNANNLFSSVDLVDWISGTSGEVIVTDNGDGTVTISHPAPLLTFADWVSGTVDQITVTDNGDGTITLSHPKDVQSIDALTYTVLEDDYILLVDTTLTATTVTIPSALIRSSFELHVKDAGQNAGINNITVETEGSETIEGAANLVIASNGWSYYLCSDGANLFII